MGQGTSREEKSFNFMLHRYVTSDPSHKLLESIRYWKKYTDLKKALSKYILIEVTDFSTLKKNGLYFCYHQSSLGDAKYIKYKEPISDNTCYIFHMCNQNTFEIEKNNSMWFKVDGKNILYRLESLAKARWVLIKCAVKLLALHKRAVVSANNPNRLKKMGIFELNEGTEID